MFASIFGTLVPMTLEKLKVDPAIATGPFISITNYPGFFRPSATNDPVSPKYDPPRHAAANFPFTPQNYIRKQP